MTMSQLDRVRQELLATARSELRYVTFGKARSRSAEQLQCPGPLLPGRRCGAPCAAAQWTLQEPLAHA